MITPPSVMDGIVTRRQLAEEWACSQRTIMRYEQQGLPVIRRGRMRLYVIERARAWLIGEQRHSGRSNRAA